MIAVKLNPSDLFKTNHLFLLKYNYYFLKVYFENCTYLMQRFNFFDACNSLRCKL